MRLLPLLAALAAARAAVASPSSRIPKRSLGFNFNEDTVRGVSIGGWLLLEPWITPSIFRDLDATRDGIVDEFTLTTQLGPDAALAVLRPHWDSWATWQDFKKIADAGMNTVRIPIGYWAYEKYGEDPYVQGAAPYVDAAIDWARSLGLKVWIDLHGAPGSQNGFDNSGQRTDNVLFTVLPETVDHMVGVLSQVSEKYARPEYYDVVVAIEFVNEPLTPRVDVGRLKDFYRRAYDNLRRTGDTAAVLSDGFLSASAWNGFLSPGDGYNVIVDHHVYQVFTPDQVAWPRSRHRNEVCNRIGGYTGADKWVVVGEWSAAMTDCAGFLNGYGVGSRYEGTYPGSARVGSCGGINSIETWDRSLRDDTRAYIEAQLTSYERFTRGWIFWNFKTEASPEWDLFRLVDAGIFPQPLTDRRFDHPCD